MTEIKIFLSTDQGRSSGETLWSQCEAEMASFTGRRTLAALLSRALSCSSQSLPNRSRLAAPLLSHLPRPEPGPYPFNLPTRYKTSGSGYSPLNDPSPNWSNRPPKETILLDGCDYEHWLIVMEFPTDPKPSEQEMIDAYVKTLSQVVGGEEEAKKKIYSVCTTTYTGFGCLISEELSYKVKGLIDDSVFLDIIYRVLKFNFQLD